MIVIIGFKILELVIHVCPDQFTVPLIGRFAPLDRILLIRIGCSQNIDKSLRCKILKSFFIKVGILISDIGLPRFDVMVLCKILNTRISFHVKLLHEHGCPVHRRSRQKYNDGCGGYAFCRETPADDFALSKVLRILNVVLINVGHRIQ